MTTFLQLIRNKRFLSKSMKTNYNRSPKMEGNPQRKALVTAVTTTKPKKPNSAIRKIVNLRIFKRGAGNIRAVIPGQGHNVKEFDNVLFRAGRSRDIPGMHYKLIRGKLAFRGDSENFGRTKSRSKYGLRRAKKYVKRKVVGVTVRKMLFAMGYRARDDSRVYVGNYTMCDELGQLRIFASQKLEDKFKKLLDRRKGIIDPTPELLEKPKGPNFFPVWVKKTPIRTKQKRRS